jgi:hypothetical protein
MIHRVTPNGYETIKNDDSYTAKGIEILRTFLKYNSVLKNAGCRLDTRHIRPNFPEIDMMVVRMSGTRILIRHERHG